MISLVKKSTLTISILTILLFGYYTTSFLNTSLFVYSQDNCNSGNPIDRDGDGISDKEEVNGVPYTKNDGTTGHYILEGSNPQHKDLYLELDYMTYHKPNNTAIDDIIRAFENSPVCDPDPLHPTGITLHITVDSSDVIPEKQYTSYYSTSSYENLPNLQSKFFGTAIEKEDPNHINLLAAKNKYYHYGVFVHQQEPNPSDPNNVKYSGRSDLPGKNFLVSLGDISWGLNSNMTHHVGSLAQQEGSLMHEFGHTLNLHHGGQDDINYKPNYISVMNYLFQLGSAVPRTLDYSECAQSSLDENNLDELKGMDVSCPPGKLTAIHCPGPNHIINTNATTNWNWKDDDVIRGGIVYDINGNGNDGRCDNTIQDLQGFEDWHNIQYVSSSNSAGAIAAGSTLASNTTNIEGAGGPGHPEISSETMKDQLTGVVEDTFFQINKINNGALSAGNITSGGTIANLTTENISPAIIAKSYFAKTLGIPGNMSNTTLAPNIPTKESVIGLIKNNNLTGAIEKLDDLKPKIDSSFGGAVADDLILGQNNQQKILSLINMAQEIIKSQR
jgi:hypothetical protein